jgi:hypothetical protein
MSVWFDFVDEIYGIPDLENRGFKIAPDRRGPLLTPTGASELSPPRGSERCVHFSHNAFQG